LSPPATRRTSLQYQERHRLLFSPDQTSIPSIFSP
jgi:hypothetical protein